MFMRATLALILWCAGVISGAAVSADAGKVGILIMAHGGAPEWNAAVEEAVSPLRRFCPVAIAFGMAERSSLQTAVEALEGQGVSRIAVVGLFVSAQSFRHQAEYFLGLRPDPPAEFIEHTHPFPHGSAGHPAGSDGALTPIQRRASLIVNQRGLYDSPEVAEIIVQRVLERSTKPHRESVLILAHGVEDDRENDRWLTRLEDVAQKIRPLKPFREVRAETLREDWMEKREQAEKRIRDFAVEAQRDGGTAIVIPFRLFGFGPYEEVLKGLSYVADGRGLLPHPRITDWIKEEAAECFSRAAWSNPFVSAGPPAR